MKINLCNALKSKTSLYILNKNLNKIKLDFNIIKIYNKNKRSTGTKILDIGGKTDEPITTLDNRIR